MEWRREETDKECEREMAVVIITDAVEDAMIDEGSCNNKIKDCCVEGDNNENKYKNNVMMETTKMNKQNREVDVKVK